MTRVLVFGMTNALAGTERVISNVVKTVGPDVRFDFLVLEDIAGNYGYLLENGNAQIVMPNKREHLLAYRREMKSFFVNHANEYDAVWVNLNILSNVDVLRLAKQYGIPRRIIHSHNSRKDGRLHQRVLSRLHRDAPAQYATDHWACSEEAARFMFGSREFTLLPNAIDFEAYRFDEDKRARMREQFGFSDDQLVIGNVGRLAGQKNQRFLIDLLADHVSESDNSVVVIVGEGELEDELKEYAAEKEVRNRILFLGEVDDIQACLSMFDVFAMPSLFEGFGIAALEAQVNGLPCIVSDGVPASCSVSVGTNFISLQDSEAWWNALKAGKREDASLLPCASAFDLNMQKDSYNSLFD